MGCDKESVKDQNQREIEAYLESNNLEAESTASGLHYIITNTGSGSHPSVNNTVFVYYKGYFLNGDTFDARLRPADPISFSLGSVILGWQEGIPLLKRGGKATLLIPSHLAYGSTPRSGIPANSVLLFDVELVNY
ncbi:UNVERIFIED_CONTAM: hypothetical protein GTU68_002227 [Idotea baltica]|nr:hypothetical protein [Idotea baltica]